MHIEFYEWCSQGVFLTRYKRLIQLFCFGNFAFSGAYFSLILFCLLFCVYFTSLIFIKKSTLFLFEIQMASQIEATAWDVNRVIKVGGINEKMGRAIDLSFTNFKYSVMKVRVADIFLVSIFLNLPFLFPEHDLVLQIRKTGLQLPEGEIFANPTEVRNEEILQFSRKRCHLIQCIHFDIPQK